MVVVAIAGGTGNVGRTIVEAIKEAGKHEVLVLARKANPAVEKQYGVKVIPVDYADEAGVTKILEDNNVHTVISGIATFTTDGSVPQDPELVRAADASKTTKRMIVSGWGAPHRPEQGIQFDSAKYKLAAEAAAKEAKDLETTVFHNGYFMDYWGMPGVKSNMTPMTMVLDIAHKQAAVPGAGNTPFVLTHTSDVAKYVAASLDLEKWDEQTFVMGDRVTWNSFIAMVEEATGENINVVHDSLEKLKRGEATELPAQIAMYEYVPKQVFQGLMSVFGQWFEDGVFDLTPEHFLNERFPEIKPWNAKDFLAAAWKKA